MSHISVASTNNTAEMFHWMNTQQLFLLVYVVSVMHALQQGYTDKAESYAKKALHLIDKQRSKHFFFLEFLFSTFVFVCKVRVDFSMSHFCYSEKLALTPSSN